MEGVHKGGGCVTGRGGSVGGVKVSQGGEEVVSQWRESRCRGRCHKEGRICVTGEGVSVEGEVS